MKKTNKIVLYFLILLCVLKIIGLLNFGHGLGDIVYFPPIILATIGHFLITKYLDKKYETLLYIPIIIISLIICILIIYKATYGRGGEYSWNGDIFYW